MSQLLVNLKLSAGEFARDFFEREIACFPCAVDTRGYAWEDFSRDFHGINPVGGEVRMYQRERLSPSDYIIGIEEQRNVHHEYIVEEVEKRFQQGATMIVNRFDKYSVLASKICQELACYSGNIVLGNAYAAKGISRTFGRHWDRHCVFAVQVLGRKRWKLYRPTIELPLYSQPSSMHKEGPLDEGRPSELVLDHILEPGDMLYVPRGWWHETSSVEGVPSLHISCGVHSIRLHDFLRWMLMSKANELLELRRAVPMGEGPTPHIRNALDAFTKECVKPELFAEYISHREAIFKRPKLVEFESFFEHRLDKSQQIQKTVSDRDISSHNTHNTEVA